MSRAHVLLLGHYPLDPPDRAPAVRIQAMAESLARRVDLTAVIGTRADRARSYPAVMRRGLNRWQGVYVESASSMMTVADWRFLRAVRRAGIPLAIYVRDYYQHFPDLYPPQSGRERLMAIGYRWTLAAYRRLATTLFVPTAGLGELVAAGRAQLLPPAGRVLIAPPGSRRPRQVIYVGANGPHDGVDLAMAAMGRVIDRAPDARLVLVLRPGDEPSKPPAHVRVVHASGAALEPWLWSSAVGLIPRRDTPYNRLALPVKLFDYLSHGLPVLTTHEAEAARLVVALGAGAAVPDAPAAYARALLDLFGHPERLAAMGQRALAAVAEEHNWDRRADTVLKALGLKPG